jgi:uncharacterized protein YecE (DUF72 family)
MQLSFEETLVEVWRQALVENAKSVELGKERYSVRRTPKQKLRQVDFVFAGSFYPANMNPRDYLSYYATKFNSVEIDSTFYACPPADRFKRWYDSTPSDFVFALKVPQTITHEKCLLGCEKEFDEFVERAKLLEDKLGPLVLHGMCIPQHQSHQFPPTLQGKQCKRPPRSNSLHLRRIFKMQVRHRHSISSSEQGIKQSTFTLTKDVPAKRVSRSSTNNHDTVAKVDDFRHRPGTECG